MDQPSKNKSPVILAEQRVGLESWCIKYVYGYAYNVLLQIRSKGSIKCSFDLPESDLADEETLMKQLTQILLLINPNLSICWSVRKEFIQAAQLNVEQELAFSSLALKHKPKAPENFYHRQWIVQQQSFDWWTDTRFESELELCLQTADRYAHNYYAWAYRNWLIEHKKPQSDAFFLLDIERLKRWIEVHISDCSAFTHLQSQILKVFALFDQSQSAPFSKYMNLLLRQMENCELWLRLYPYQESVYLHRRFIIKQIFRQSSRFQPHVNHLLSIKSQERVFVQEEIENAEYRQNLEQCRFVIKRHLTWLKNEFSFDFSEFKQVFESNTELD